MFEFVHIADTHLPAGEKNFKAVINDINTCVKPSFVVITGDITDHGTREEYESYLEYIRRLHCNVYTGTGNHDLQWWTSNGKNDFKDRVGPLFYSFDHGGVHFVMLDSAVAFVTDGSYGKKQLEWLAEDLSTMPDSAPVIIFAHHPSKLQDNVTEKARLINLLKHYNVVAFMGGHMHEWGYTVENGILWEYIADQKNNNCQGYAVVEVTSNMLRIFQRHASDGSKVLWLTAPMINNRKASLWVANATAKANGDVDVLVKIDKAPDGVASVKVRADNYGPWTTLKPKGSIWTGTISIAAYAPSLPYGRHFVGVNMTDGTGKVWKEYKEYEWNGGNVVTKWIYQTGDSVQSTPTCFEGMVYAGSTDGKVYALDDDGRMKWTYATDDQVISKPAVYKDANEALIIIGSCDKKLYALNTENGSLKWYYITEGCVISDPLVDNGTVYFGSGDNYIYSINAGNGSLIWRFKANGLLRQRPVVYNGILYAFVRDLSIGYAINTADGSLCWRENACDDLTGFALGDVRPVITGGNKLWCIDVQNTKAGYLDPTNGNLEWTYPYVDNIGSIGPATDGTRVFYAGNGGREIYAFNITDNSLEWHRDLRTCADDNDFQEFQVNNALICDGDILYHVSDRGRITGFDPADGHTVFNYRATAYPERTIWQIPEVYNKTVCMGGLDGKIYAVRYNGVKR